MLKLLMELYTCKNCINQFEGHFCNVCGQKPAHRLDIKHVLHEAIHVFTHADKGIFTFIRKVITHPGTMALEYVEGKRKKYFNPFQYLILIVGVTAFAISKSRVMEDTIGAITTQKGSARVIQFQHLVEGLFQKYFNIVLFTMIPFYAFFSKIFFRSKGYNYAENIVLQCYIQAQQNTIFATVYLAAYFLRSQFGGTPFMIFLLITGIILNGIACKQFFKVSLLQGILKTILVYICLEVVIIALTMIITFLYLTITKH